MNFHDCRFVIIENSTWMSFWTEEIYIYNNFKLYARIANHALAILSCIIYAIHWNKYDALI